MVLCSTGVPFCIRFVSIQFVHSFVFILFVRFRDQFVLSFVSFCVVFCVILCRHSVPLFVSFCPTLSSHLCHFLFRFAPPTCVTLSVISSRRLVPLFLRKSVAVICAPWVSRVLEIRGYLFEPVGVSFSSPPTVVEHGTVAVRYEKFVSLISTNVGFPVRPQNQ